MTLPTKAQGSIPQASPTNFKVYMAIPSTPTNFYLQSGNQQNFLSWDLTPTALSYSVQRSTDGVNFTVLAAPTPNSYLDAAVTIGALYYYQVAAVNGSGTSPYTTVQSIVPTPTSEMSLGGLRLAAQQRADRVNSNFVTLPEWNSYLNQSMYELYDILIDIYEDYAFATPVQFVANGTSQLYPIPDGTITFTNALDGTTQFVAPPLYKLLGVDMNVNTANNARLTVSKFGFASRNQFIYPNSASTIYGVYNLQYRMMGNQINLIPNPSANQQIVLWYIPRLPQLLKDNDITTIGYSGWLEYVIVRAAILALLKEESDVTMLAQALAALKMRIEASAMNRDAGRPDRVSDTRGGNWGSGGDGIGGGFQAGF